MGRFAEALPRLPILDDVSRDVWCYFDAGIATEGKNEALTYGIFRHTLRKHHGISDVLAQE